MTWPFPVMINPLTPQTKQQANPWFKQSHWSWRSLLLVVVLLGIALRGYNLAHKAYWGDEVFTAMRLSGYAAAEVSERLYTGAVVDVAAAQRFLHPGPERDLGATLTAFTSSPEHTPLYYLLASLWMRWLDPVNPLDPATLAHLPQSVALLRGLSALLSLLAFPAMYWLCLELFQTATVPAATVGRVAIALLAASPFHLLYAQEARPYALWIVTILLSSAALLRAQRRPSGWSWGLYALTLTLSLYTFLFSALVALGHGIYIVAAGGWRDRRRLGAYLLATAAGLLAFAPWGLVMLRHAPQLQRNVAHLSQVPDNLMQLWLLNLSRIFVDVNQGPSLLNPLLWMALGLSLGALYGLVRQAPTPTWLFVLTLASTTGLALVAADILLGGQRSAIARYPIPAYLGVQVAVAFWLARAYDPATTIRHRKRWRRGLVALLLLGLLSCGISSQMVMWWNKGPFKTQHNPAIAQVVNQAAQSLETAGTPETPLLISDASVERVLALTYSLDPMVRLQLLPRGTMPNLPADLAAGGAPTWLYQPSPRLRDRLERRLPVRVQPTDIPWLWQLQPDSAS